MVPVKGKLTTDISHIQQKLREVEKMTKTNRNASQFAAAFYVQDMVEMTISGAPREILEPESGEKVMPTTIIRLFKILETVPDIQITGIDLKYT